MGKDRNLPLSYRGKKKEHFSDTEVCKFFLVAFCPHDLFPNTKADMGKCSKRHDEYYKKMYERDSNREMYQRRYEEELMELLERIISQLDSKIRKTLAKIDVPAEADRPKEIHEKIDGLNKKINFFLEQAERLGEEGRLDESEGIMKEIDRLKLQRSELSNMSENPLLQNEKQMHICEVCGAMQSLTDTDKRLTIHLEGKLHTGYALIRKTLAEIKQRRDEYRRVKEKEAETKVLEAKEKQAKDRELHIEDTKDKSKTPTENIGKDSNIAVPLSMSDHKNELPGKLSSREDIKSRLPASSDSYKDKQRRSHSRHREDDHKRDPRRGDNNGGRNLGRERDRSKERNRSREKEREHRRDHKDLHRPKDYGGKDYKEKSHHSKGHDY